jgi:hypothetical protein
MFALTGEHEFFDLLDLAAERLVEEIEKKVLAQ